MKIFRFVKKALYRINNFTKLSKYKSVELYFNE